MVHFDFKTECFKLISFEELENILDLILVVIDWVECIGHYEDFQLLQVPQVLDGVQAAQANYVLVVLSLQHIDLLIDFIEFIKVAF